MARSELGDHESALAAALVDLLLPTSRLLLKGGVGVDQLIRAAKQAYIKAAFAEILPPGSRVNVSRLSVATGLTRKDVSSLLGQIRTQGVRLTHRTKEQRAIRVLRGWTNDQRFRKANGRPEELSVHGRRCKFALLVKLYGGDVTPRAVLGELERMDAVVLTHEGTIRMKMARRHSQKQVRQQAIELARLFGDFVGTVAQPLRGAKPPVFFGFRECAAIPPSEAARFERTFAKRGAALLDGFDQWVDGRRKGRDESHEQGRVGLGVYLVNASVTPPEGQ
ncbi:MAG: DUF6502 family protein [Xanthobacteraceae bacterium]